MSGGSTGTTTTTTTAAALMEAAAAREFTGMSMGGGGGHDDGPRLHHSDRPHFIRPSASGSGSLSASASASASGHNYNYPSQMSSQDQIVSRPMSNPNPSVSRGQLLEQQQLLDSAEGFSRRLSATSTPTATSASSHQHHHNQGLSESLGGAMYNNHMSNKESLRVNRANAANVNASVNVNPNVNVSPNSCASFDGHHHHHEFQNQQQLHHLMNLNEGHANSRNEAHLGRQSLKPAGNTHNNIFGDPPASPSVKKEYKMSSDIFGIGRIIDESGQHKQNMAQSRSRSRLSVNSNLNAGSPQVHPHVHQLGVRAQYSNSNEKIIGPSSSHHSISSLDADFNKNLAAEESKSSESMVSNLSMHSNSNGQRETPGVGDKKANARENGFNPVTGVGYTEVEQPKSQRRHFSQNQVRSTPLW